MTEKYEGPLPGLWRGGEATAKWWRGRLHHLYRLTKPCGECGKEMTIDVTKGALDGTVKNAGLHLKRCAKCRAQAKALDTTSRPHVNGEEPISKHSINNEAATIITTMKEELTGLYAQLKEMRERLAKYESVEIEKFPWSG